MQFFHELALKIIQLNLNQLFVTENEECVKLLIQNWATINIKDLNGVEPLQLAINTGMILYKNNIGIIVKSDCYLFSSKR